MGILGFGSFVKPSGKKEPLSPSGRYHVPLSFFSGYRVAIDGNYWLYNVLSTSIRDEIDNIDILHEEINPINIINTVLHRLQLFVDNFLNNSIVPVFVFDGIAPPEKDETRAKRQQIREKNKQQIDTERQRLLEIEKTSGVLFVDQTELRKLSRAAVTIKYNEIDIVKKVLKSLGIPVLQAIGEGEELCACLSTDGITKGVYSEDTDNLTHGVQFLITKIYYNEVDIYNLNHLLKDFEITFDQFVDLCIMCGCDYNNRIRGIGPFKSYKLIKEYGTIDKMPFDEEQLTTLNHIKCRELFKIKKARDVCKDIPDNIQITQPIGTEENITLWEKYGIINWANKMFYFSQNPIIAKNFIQRYQIIIEK